MQTRHAVRLQPRQFREDTDVPEWAFFPHLHLLFLRGDGAGLLQTIGDEAHYLSCAYLTRTRERVTESFCVAQQLTRVRYEPPPKGIHRRPSEELRVYGIDPIEECVAYERQREPGQLLVEERVLPRQPETDHPLTPDGEYAVRYLFLGDDTAFELRQLQREIKPEYLKKMRECGVMLDERGRAVGTNAAKRAFGAFLSEMKQSFIKRRVAELLHAPEHAHGGAALDERARKRIAHAEADGLACRSRMRTVCGMYPAGFLHSET